MCQKFELGSITKLPISEKLELEMSRTSLIFVLKSFNKAWPRLGAYFWQQNARLDSRSFTFSKSLSSLGSGNSRLVPTLLKSKNVVKVDTTCINQTWGNGKRIKSTFVCAFQFQFDGIVIWNYNFAICTMYCECAPFFHRFHRLKDNFHIFF